MPRTIQEYLKEPYARILIPDALGGYSAEILEFPGCFAEGETADETMQALERAAESWIQAALAQGQEIPEPFNNQGYAGKIALRLPRSLHRKAMQFAERDNTSLNQFLITAVAAKIGAEDFYDRLITQLLNRFEERFSPTIQHIMNIALNVRINPTHSAQTQQLTSQDVRIDHLVAQASTDIAVQ